MNTPDIPWEVEVQAASSQYGGWEVFPVKFGVNGRYVDSHHVWTNRLYDMNPRTEKRLDKAIVRCQRWCNNRNVGEKTEHQRLLDRVVIAAARKQALRSTLSDTGNVSH